MRISTRQSFLNSISNMQNSQNKLANLQNQISTGKRLNKPSDDPVAAAQVVKLNRELAQTAKFQDNVDVTQRRLELEETVMSNLNNAIDRIRELTLQAGNGVLTDSDRKSIATEIRGLADYAAGLMNTQDAQGEYLFSGSKGFTKPYEKNADGSYSYVGDDGQRKIQVAPDLYVASNDSGQYLFEAASEAVMVKQFPAISNVTDFEVTDETVLTEFAREKGDLTLQIQLDPNSPTQSYQYQLLDSDGQPVPLSNNGALSAELPDIGTGDTVRLHGMTFKVSEPELAQLNVDFEQDGVREITVADRTAAAAFVDQYGELDMAFDGAGNFTLTDLNGDPVTLPDQTYTEGEELVLGGFRLDIGTPEAGDSIKLGLPLSDLSPVRTIEVTDLGAIYDNTSIQIAAASPTGSYDFATNTDPQTFDLTVDGSTYTLTIDRDIASLEDAKAELTEALSEQGVTGVIVSDNGSELALSLTGAQAGSEIEVANFGTNIAAVFGFTDGQRSDFEPVAITAAGPTGTYAFATNDDPQTFDLTVDGETYTLTSATAQAGSEIAVSNFGPDIAAVFNFTDGQRDYYQTAATDAMANGGALKLTYDLDADAYFVDEPTLSINGFDMASIGLALTWDTTNPPADGDSITVKLPPYAESTLRVSTEKQNVLDVAQELADVLDIPVENGEIRLELTQQIATSLDKLTEISERNVEARTRIGARINSLEDTRSANADYKLFTESALSSIEDVDFAEAVSELQLEQAVLQAAQASFVRISELSLFNYLK